MKVLIAFPYSLTLSFVVVALYGVMILASLEALQNSTSELWMGGTNIRVFLFRIW